MHCLVLLDYSLEKNLFSPFKSDGFSFSHPGLTLKTFLIHLFSVVLLWIILSPYYIIYSNDPTHY